MGRIVSESCSVCIQICIHKLSCSRETSLCRENRHSCRVVVDTCRVIVVDSEDELVLACLLLCEEHTIVLIWIAGSIKLILLAVHDLLCSSCSLFKVECIIVHELNTSSSRVNRKVMILSECTFEKTELRLESKSCPLVHAECRYSVRKICNCKIHIIKHLLHDELSRIPWSLKLLRIRCKFLINPWNITEELHLFIVKECSEETCKRFILGSYLLIFTTIHSAKDSIDTSEIGPCPAAA